MFNWPNHSDLGIIGNILQNLSISNAKFGQRRWCQMGNKGQPSSDSVTSSMGVNGFNYLCRSTEISMLKTKMRPLIMLEIFISLHILPSYINPVIWQVPVNYMWKNIFSNFMINCIDQLLSISNKYFTRNTSNVCLFSLLGYVSCQNFSHHTIEKQIKISADNSMKGQDLKWHVHARFISLKCFPQKPQMELFLMIT